MPDSPTTRSRAWWRALAVVAFLELAVLTAAGLFYGIPDAAGHSPALPALRWSAWAFVIGLAVAVPLLLFLRAIRFRHLTLFQRCILVSLLAHAFLLMGFHVVQVSQQIVEYVARETGVLTSVNLEVAREAEVKLQIRRQLSYLPVEDPTLSDLQEEAPPRPLPVAIEPPRAPLTRLDPERIVTAPQDARRPWPAEPERLAIASPGLRVASPAVEPVRLERVSAPEDPLRLAQPPRVESLKTTVAAPLAERSPISLSPVPARADERSLARLTTPEPPRPPSAEQAAEDTAIEPPPAWRRPKVAMPPEGPPARAEEHTSVADVLRLDRPLAAPRVSAEPAELPRPPRMLTEEPSPLALPEPHPSAGGQVAVPAAAAERVEPQPMPVQLARRPEPFSLAAPKAPFLRAPERRQLLLKRHGGSKESEAAVKRALEFLAGNQEADGRWTYITTGRGGQGARHKHDGALTALGALCFLAADHTPAKDGPHKRTVGKAVGWLLAQVGDDGDLRGGGDMYDQAIGTLALAEAALMTDDRPCRDAAVRAGRFILNAMNRKTGGWRYEPGDDGDTSIFGWQVMALHSAELLGLALPAEMRRGAARWLAAVSASDHAMLAGYRDTKPTPPMTAEAVFSRFLLGQKLTREQIDEAAGFLLKNPPPDDRRDLYYLYYGSLTMMQIGGRPWERWNALMRDPLIKLQRRDGALAGSWDADTRWGVYAGRVYATALATLTLEVYYRYLPMYGGQPGEGK